MCEIKNASRELDLQPNKWSSQFGSPPKKERLTFSAQKIGWEKMGKYMMNKSSEFKMTHQVTANNRLSLFSCMVSVEKRILFWH